ncbi:hydrogenase/urease nickel incorporation protein HypA [Helicobacter sp. MIT 05-5293]|uniref:hydrogenase/urease nickel incorporation protein HypA n=1 Tax=Helicobacter sp. MIT 05-5293 TaxID=1548149 RepID=UPI00051E049C|nr:hydrogenase/urease nickel incorporation protein HypA [Helicobacter sp. MIT 05-5293]TLD81618.1 hydrogenase/urease nickel incorporation protein HypA [Helicobacter sp. MIT 05-5293]
MHEYSIVASLIEMCEDYALEHHADNIATIRIAIGERSGVDQMLIKNSFETFKLDSQVCRNANLEIETQKVILECQTCHHRFDAKDLTYSTCPKCHSQQTIITQGKELHLMALELDVPS